MPKTVLWRYPCRLVSISYEIADHFQRAAQLTEIDVSPAMPQCFRQEYMVTHHGMALEDMFFGVFDGFGCLVRLWGKVPLLLQCMFPDVLELLFFVWSQSRLLLFPQAFGRDFRQLVRACFTHRTATSLSVGLRPCSCVNCSMAASRCALRRLYFSNRSWSMPRIKAIIQAFGIAMRLDFITETANFFRKSAAVHLCQIGASLVKARCLQRLPTTFYTVIGQIGCDSMCVQLWFRFTAGLSRYVATTHLRHERVHSERYGAFSAADATVRALFDKETYVAYNNLETRIGPGFKSRWDRLRCP